MPRRFHQYQTCRCFLPSHGTQPLAQAFVCLSILIFLFSGLSIDAFNGFLQHSYFAESLDPASIDSDEDTFYNCFPLAANPIWPGIGLFFLTFSLNIKNSLPRLSDVKFSRWIPRAPPSVS
jgi:hypothetical protein